MFHAGTPIKITTAGFKFQIIDIYNNVSDLNHSLSLKYFVIILITVSYACKYNFIGIHIR